jgi:hypothetical protein
MAKDYDIAKKSVQDEILEAVGNAAQQGDVQEILEKVVNGVNVNEKVPVSIQTFNASATKTTATEMVTATGKGYADFSLKDDKELYELYLSVDGVVLLDYARASTLPRTSEDNDSTNTVINMKIRFNESFSLYAKRWSNTTGTLYAKGMLVFEE